MEEQGNQNEIEEQVAVCTGFCLSVQPVLLLDLCHMQQLLHHVAISQRARVHQYRNMMM